MSTAGFPGLYFCVQNPSTRCYFCSTCPHAICVAKKKRNAKCEHLYNSVVQLTNAWMQVADMAERSPDRQARVAAIEFLHAVLLWMVGERSRSPLRAWRI